MVVVACSCRSCPYSLLLVYKTSFLTLPSIFTTTFIYFFPSFSLVAWANCYIVLALKSPCVGSLADRCWV